MFNEPFWEVVVPSSFILAIILVAFYQRFQLLQKNKKHPIVMLCRVTGAGDMNRIGVVLFEDFVNSSRFFWMLKRQTLTPKVERVSISPTFVFETNDFRALDVLLEGCRVQEGMFNVPLGRYDRLAQASEHIHKRPFDFQLLKNK
jgi:hypothetical protein